VASESSPTNTLPNLTLILGGTRSGKSTYAEGLIERVGGGVYLATAEALDAEMEERVRIHRDRRGAQWQTVEEPLELAQAINRASSEYGRPVLVDCLTLWLSNLMYVERDVPGETDALISSLSECQTPVVMVSNEVGLGIVPDNALARTFRDEAGRINQRLAEAADRVVFVAAGLPLIMKG